MEQDVFVENYPTCLKGPRIHTSKSQDLSTVFVNEEAAETTAFKPLLCGFQPTNRSSPRN
jgi:hypothetical protein